MKNLIPVAITRSRRRPLGCLLSQSVSNGYPYRFYQKGGCTFPGTIFTPLFGQSCRPILLRPQSTPCWGWGTSDIGMDRNGVLFSSFVFPRGTPVTPHAACPCRVAAPPHELRAGAVAAAAVGGVQSPGLQRPHDSSVACRGLCVCWAAAGPQSDRSRTAVGPRRTDIGSLAAATPQHGPNSEEPTEFRSTSRLASFEDASALLRDQAVDVGD